MLEVGFSTTTGGGPCFCTHFRKAGNYSVMMGMFNPIAARISCRVRTFLARRWHSGWWKQPESMQAPRVLRTVGMSVGSPESFPGAMSWRVASFQLLTCLSLGKSLTVCQR